ncbi:MAG TPA: DUF4432 family protein [Phycisphaeraceae bacterium]
MAPQSALDFDKIGCIHQVGGIRTARFDFPDAGGSPGCRVALVDTGSGLRFTVALDRGGDIVEAFYQQHSLAFLTPNGYKPPSHAYHRGLEWLHGWPGGLITTCGPQTIGGPRQEDGQEVSLHGRFSNQPAALVALHNPDSRRGDLTMRLDLVIRDSRMFGPVYEIRRSIRCTLGQPVIEIQDEVVNLGNTRVPHNWLYHINFGYPLVDKGARLVFRGRVTDTWNRPSDAPLGNLERLKRIPDPLPEHRSGGERGFVFDAQGDRQRLARAGILNRKLSLGVEIQHRTDQLPRVANWQHFGSGGSYVTAIEPFWGSLMGKENDAHPLAEQWLEPGQSRRYDLTLRVLTGRAELDALARHDNPLRS